MKKKRGKKMRRKKYNLFIILVELLLFILVLVFSNDIINESISKKIVPFLCLLMMLNSIIGFRLNRNDEENK